MKTETDWGDAAISKRLEERLKQFRARLERESDQSIGDLEVNAALLLLDLCRHLGLEEDQSVRVLGIGGVEYVLEVMEAHLSTRVRSHTTRRRPLI